MLLLVCVHVAGVVISGKLHGENLSRAMVTGLKNGEPQDAIPTAYPALGLVLLVAVLGFWGYAWHHPFQEVVSTVTAEPTEGKEIHTNNASADDEEHE